MHRLAMLCGVLLDERKHGLEGALTFKGRLFYSWLMLLIQQTNTRHNFNAEGTSEVF